MSTLFQLHSDIAHLKDNLTKIALLWQEGDGVVLLGETVAFSQWLFSYIDFADNPEASTDISTTAIDQSQTLSLSELSEDDNAINVLLSNDTEISLTDGFDIVLDNDTKGESEGDLDKNLNNDLDSDSDNDSVSMAQSDEEGIDWFVLQTDVEQLHPNTQAKLDLDNERLILISDAQWVDLTTEYERIVTISG